MINKIKFSDAARYLIRVDGELHVSIKDVLENYQVKEPTLTFCSTVTIIDIQVKDQAGLSGLLNELYNNHCIILTVQQVMKESYDTA